MVTTTTSKKTNTDQPIHKIKPFSQPMAVRDENVQAEPRQAIYKPPPRADKVFLDWSL